MNTVDNMQDVLDSRDVIARIEELQALRDECEGSSVDGNAPNGSEAADFDASDEGIELAALLELASDCEGYSDWEHGEALIRESYFQDYAQELAEDCADMPKDAKWPMNCIDWEQAAKELAYDYALVSFAGVDYYIRNC